MPTWRRMAADGRGRFAARLASGPDPRPLVTAAAPAAVAVAIAVLLASLVPLGGPSIAVRGPPDAAWSGTPGDFLRSTAGLQAAHLDSVLAVVLALAALAWVAGSATSVALLLDRRFSLRREVALRRALGATRGQVRRERWREDAAVAATALGLGLPLAIGGARLLERTWPASFSPFEGLRLDAPGAWLAALAPVALVLAVCARAGSGSRRTHRDPGPPAGDEALDDAPEALVVLQVAVAATLVAAAWLLLRGPGAGEPRGAGASSPFPHAADTVILGVAPSAADEAERGAIYARLLAEVRAATGGAAATLSSPGADLGLGMVGRTVATCRCRRGGMEVPVRLVEARHHAVGPGYFAVHGIPILAGREFTAGDGPGAAPVVLIDEAMAAEGFPGDDPIGRPLRIAGQGPADPPHTIVGVVPVVRPPGLGSPARNEPAVYVAVLQHPPAAAQLGVRASGSPGRIAATAAAAVRLADPDARLGPASTLAAELRRHAGPLRWLGRLLLALAAVGIASAALGVGAAASFRLRRRSREIGIRRLCGATSARIITEVVRESLRRVGLGLALAAPFAAAAWRGLDDLLGGLPAPDAGVVAGVAGLLLAAGVVGALPPARRAARLPPAVALGSAPGSAPRGTAKPRRPE